MTEKRNKNCILLIHIFTSRITKHLRDPDAVGQPRDSFKAVLSAYDDIAQTRDTLTFVH